MFQKYLDPFLPAPMDLTFKNFYKIFFQNEKCLFILQQAIVSSVKCSEQLPQVVISMSYLAEISTDCWGRTAQLQLCTSTPLPVLALI